MTLGLGHVGLRHVDPQRRQARPGLLDEVEKAPGAAAEIDEPQAALIAAGEHLVQRRQRLPPDRIGGALEQHLDLGVVALGRLVRHPAARLEVEILQIVVGPLAAGLRAQHFPPLALLAAAVDLRQVLEEQPRAREQARQRAVVIRRLRIDAGLDIGEVALEESGHVRVEPPAVGHRRIGAGTRPRGPAVASTRLLGQSSHQQAVADIPGDPWQLPGAIGDAGGEAGDRTGHAVSTPRCALAAAKYRQQRGTAPAGQGRLCRRRRHYGPKGSSRHPP